MTRCLLAVIVLCMAGKAAAQRTIPLDSVFATDTALRHLVSLRNGTARIGRVTAVTADSVRVQRDTVTWMVARSQVTRVREVSAYSVRFGSHWFDDPTIHRLFFTATANPLKAGQRSGSSVFFLRNGVEVGLTGRLGVGASVTWFPGEGLTHPTQFAKYTLVNRPGRTLAVGVHAGSHPLLEDLPDEDDANRDDPQAAGLMFMVGTAGDTDGHLTFGLGWRYGGGIVAPRPAVLTGFQWRISRDIAFLYEGWRIPGRVPQVTYPGYRRGMTAFGVRFLGEVVTTDVGWIGSPGGVGPWLTFGYAF